MSTENTELLTVVFSDDEREQIQELTYEAAGSIFKQMGFKTRAQRSTLYSYMADLLEDLSDIV